MQVQQRHHYLGAFFNFYTELDGMALNAALLCLVCLCVCVACRAVTWIDCSHASLTNP